MLWIKNALHRSVVTKLIHKDEFQKSITLHSIDMFVIFFNKCLLIQVENLNMTTNLACWQFYGMSMCCIDYTM